MINEQRLVKDFIEMAKISSPSLGERFFADYLKKVLSELGLEVYEDNTGNLINGTAGNVVAILRGDTPYQVMFSSHMDTVTPCDNIVPKIENGRIKSSGNSILGADDKAGIAAIIEAVRVIKENKIPHPELVLIFSVAEEIRLLGAYHLDHSKYNIKYGFILDSSGKPGSVVKRAPYHNSIKIKFIGKAAHAGIEPEKGINALYIAANVLSKLKMGRIDEDTTFNIGLAKGGRATNIVMEEFVIEGEARSFSEQRLGEVCAEIIERVRNTIEEFNANFSYEIKREYDGFDFAEDSEIITIVKNSTEKLGLAFKAESLGGGSDTNVYNSKGINTVNLGIGMSKPHALDEYIEIKDLIDTSKLVLEIIKSFEE